MNRDDHERAIVLRAPNHAYHRTPSAHDGLPGDREPYDLSQPFDPDRFLDGFTEEVHEHQVDPDSPLGRAMAAAREASAQPGYEPIDPDDFHVTPVPVELDGDETLAMPPRHHQRPTV